MEQRTAGSWCIGLLALVTMGPVTTAIAQSNCTLDWVASSIPGTNSVVNACLWWDPDGAGPRVPVLVVGGGFQVAGDRLAANIAAYDPQTDTWSTFGSGMDNYVTSLAAMPNGDLVAGGAFTTANGQPCNHLARWNGTTWSPLGLGVDSYVYAVAARPNGNLVASGLFTTAGGSAANYIAEWDGSTWSTMNGGLNMPPAFGQMAPATCLLAMPNGDVVAGGRFTMAGGVAVSCIARWNGTTWAPLGSGIPAPGFVAFWNPVSALALLPNGDLVAGGAFQQAGGIPATNVARWNGTNWAAMGGGAPGVVLALATQPNGSVFAAGRVTGQDVLRWNGTQWLTVGSALVVNALAAGSGSVVAMGGLFASPGSNVALWNGASWAPPTSRTSPGFGFDGVVLGATHRNADLIVGGAFEQAGGIVMGPVALWNGVAWSGLGGNFSGHFPAPPQIQVLTSRRDGSVVAGGIFTYPGACIAQWDGTGWSPLGAGADNMVAALLETANGDLIAGGWFSIPASRIARWNGNAWSALGSGVDGAVRALAQLPNGDLVAAGDFSTAGGAPANRIARWDGVAWHALGSGLDDSVEALCAMPDGSLVAGGRFNHAGGAPAARIARWNGTNWSPLGAWPPSTTVHVLRLLPNGELLAAGDSGLLERWNGTTWSSVGGGTNGTVHAIVELPNGSFAAAGDFTTVGSNGAVNVGMLATPCPATSLDYGIGCAGANGIDTLRAETLPWAGTTFRGKATGLPAQSLAFGLLGLQATSIPLGTILPQGLVGCDVLLAPVSTNALLVTNGEAQSPFVIPAAPYVVGVQVLAQVISLETNGAGGLLAVTSSNGLQLQIGAF